MMKKGFTLVELAIVLVIVGILMAMVTKGKSLIDATRLKNDLAVINTISIAVATYAGDTPKGRGFYKLTKQMLLDNRLLDDDVITLRYGRGDIDIFGIIISPNGNFIKNTEDWSLNIGLIFENNLESRRLGCMADYSLDDGIDQSGYARAYHKDSPAGDGSKRNPYDCRDINPQQFQTAYQVF